MRLPAALTVVAMVIPLSAAAQVDFSGEWSARYHEDQEHRIPGPWPGDYTGLPINDAARLKADSWDASILSLREHQAKPHPSTYSLRGPANIRILKVIDPVTQRTIGFELFGTFGQATRTIWLDERPHPPAHAPHTWAGFSTGQWDGDTLTVTTTHLKVGWLQRNGVAHSDRATMIEHFIRHGDVLTVITAVDDPVYLEEPLIRSTSWVRNPFQELGRTQFDIVDEVASLRKGEVPHHLPGSEAARTKLTEFAEARGVPVEAARGGALTLYPEYRARLRALLAAAETNDLEAVPPRPARPAPAAPPVLPASEEGIHLLHVQGNVHLLTGAGANITVQVGDEGVLVVDSGAPGRSDEVLAAIERLTGQPVRIVINTHVHADHVSGNVALGEVGQWFGDNAPGNFGLRQSGPRVIAHERVLARMSAPTGVPSPMPFAAWPTETFFGAGKELFFNGEAIQLLHRPAAHTDGDVVVFFRRSDVVSTGDVFGTTGYPVIDEARGGTVDGLIDALNHVLDLTIPQDKQEGGTYVIPGHGRLADEADVVEYRDMVTIVRDRVRDLARQGRTLAQVKAARPTLDYDGRYGSPDRFIEAIYGEAIRSAASR
jgi:glyoxylase-like metal-dependent hydrolase (beta-lactamase superfamily II)